MYIKAKLSEDVEIKVELYIENIFELCDVCGAEREVPRETIMRILKDTGDFSSAIYCSNCRKERNREIRLSDLKEKK